MASFQVDKHHLLANRGTDKPAPAPLFTCDEVAPLTEAAQEDQRDEIPEAGR